VKVPITLDPVDLELQHLLGNGCFGEIWKAKVTVIIGEKKIVDHVAIKESTGDCLLPVIN